MTNSTSSNSEFSVKNTDPSKLFYARTFEPLKVLLCYEVIFSFKNVANKMLQILKFDIMKHKGNCLSTYERIQINLYKFNSTYHKMGRYFHLLKKVNVLR